MGRIRYVSQDKEVYGRRSASITRSAIQHYEQNCLASHTGDSCHAASPLI